MKIIFVLAFILLAGASARMVRRFDATADCFQDVKELTELVPQMMNGASKMDLSTILLTAFSVKPLLQKTAKDCARGDWLKFVNVSAVQGPVECISDIMALIPKIQNLIEDMESGNITKIIADIQEMMPLIQKTIADCGGAARNLKHFKAGKLINFYNTPQCQAIREESLPAFQQLGLALMTKNYRQAAEAVPQTIEQLMHILHTCSVRPANYNFMEMNNEQNGCIEDIIAIAELIPQIVAHIQAGDLAAIISDVQKLIGLIGQAKQDCIGEIKRVNPMDYLNVTTVNDLAKCLQDIVDMIPLLQKLIGDVTAGNITAIIEDIQKLVPKVNQTIIDCSQLKPHSLKHLINFYRDSQCLDQVKQLQTHVVYMAFMYQAKDMKSFSQQTGLLVKQAASTIKACSKRRQPSFNMYQRYMR